MQSNLNITDLTFTSEYTTNLIQQGLLMPTNDSCNDDFVFYGRHCFESCPVGTATNLTAECEGTTLSAYLCTDYYIEVWEVCITYIPKGFALKNGTNHLIMLSNRYMSEGMVLDSVYYTTKTSDCGLMGGIDDGLDILCF